MGTTGNMGSVTAKFTADTRSFDTSVTGVDKQLVAAGNSAKQSAAKIAAAGAEVDRVAKLQENAKERARRAWALELQAQDKTIQKEKEVSRAREMAALRADMEARSVQNVAKAHESFALSAEKTGEMLKRGLALAGITFGADMVVSGFKEMVKSTMESGVQLGKLHQQTGISVENLSVLKFAAAETGIEFESLTKGFKKLAVTTYDADNGSKTAAKGFEQLGIHVADLRAKGDDMYAVLALVADKFRAMPDGIAKSDAAAKIFGARMGSELIPLLNQGSEALGRFKLEAPIFSDQDIENMKKMHEATVQLDAAWKRSSVTITTALAPAMTWYLNNFAEGLDVIIGKSKTAWEWLTKVKTPASYAWDDDKPKAAATVTPKATSTPPKPSGGGGRTSGTSKDSGVITLQTSDLGNGRTVVTDWYNQSMTDPTGDNNTKANEEQSNKWFEETFKFEAAMAKLQEQSLAIFSKLPDVGLRQQQQQETFKQSMGDMFSDWIARATDLRAIVAESFNQTMGSVNSAILGRKRGGWSQAGSDIFSGLAGSGLRYAEGSAMKGFGLGSLGKRDGSSASTALFVQMAGSGGAAGTAAGGLLASLNKSDWASQLFGGKLFGSGSFFGGKADGGIMNPGGFYIAGERGPEPISVGSTSRATSNSDFMSAIGGRGGSTHYYSIDARGTDPALTQANVQRAMQATHAQSVADAGRMMSDRQRRIAQ